MAGKSFKTIPLLSKGEKIARATLAAKTGKEMAKAYIAKPLGERIAAQTAAFVTGFAKTAPKGAVFGAGFGASGAMQDNADFNGIVKRTAEGSLWGAGVAGVVGGVGERGMLMKNVKGVKMQEAAQAAYLRGFKLTSNKMKEKAGHIVPELLEEGWWGTRAELMRRAQEGQQLSIKEYERLGELSGVVSGEDMFGLLETIDDEIQKYYVPGSDKIITGAEPKVAALRSTWEDIMSVSGFVTQDEGFLATAKAAALDKYMGPDSAITDVTSRAMAAANLSADDAVTGTFTTLEKSRIYDNLAKAGEVPNLSQAAQYEDLRKLAQEYGAQIYESRSAMSVVSDNKVLSQIQKVDDELRTLINTQNPEYAAINKVYHRTGELMDMLVASNPDVKSGKLVPTLQFMGTVMGAMGIGYATGKPGIVIAGTAAITGLAVILSSTWFATGGAVLQNKIGQKLLELPPEQAMQWVHILSAQGAKGAAALLSE